MPTGPVLQTLGIRQGGRPTGDNFPLTEPGGRGMPEARINGVRLHFEVHGRGAPLVFVHEFAGDSGSWDPQVRIFARRYQVISYNAR